MLQLTYNNDFEYCYAFIGRDNVVRKDGKALNIDDLNILQQAMPVSVAMAEKELNYNALNIQRNREVEDPLPADYCKEETRYICYKLDEEDAVRLSRAKAVSEWIRMTCYCPTCGHELQAHSALSALECDHCKRIIFPRIEPCIIVLVNKGNRMLLARHAQRHKSFYACLAGFMEAGETAEQAVRREVMEETGLTVKNIKYFGTQSWPYPSQLMIAYTAEYESGEIKVQESEIADAEWFAPGECPDIPRPGSIAYEMIMSFTERTKAGLV